MAREHTHDSITDIFEGTLAAIYGALLQLAAETLVETVDAVADIVGYMRAGHTQNASVNTEGTKGRTGVHQEKSVPIAIAALTAPPMTCNCGLPVRVWVVSKQSHNYGRTFVCCTKSHKGSHGSGQCHYFRFADELPVEAATNYQSFRRKQQQRESMFNRKWSDGHANVSNTDQEPEIDDDGGMQFQTAKGGNMEFVHHATGKVLATVSIATEGRSEVQVTLPEEIKGDAHAAIKPAAEGMEQERIDASAKRLPAIRRESDKGHKWPP